MYHQQKVTSVMNVRELINLSLLKTTVSTWTTATNGTKWLTAIQLARENGLKNFITQSTKSACVQTCVFVFCFKTKHQNQPSVTTWEEEHL
jgi:hypothetical protein